MESFLVSLGVSPDAVATFRIDTLLRLLLAAGLGGAVGLEREYSGKPAGLRTNLLICVGAALITELSVYLAVAPGGGDPARLAAQIVSGIGFIGAGTILHGRGTVTGLTSAATLWVVAAIGIAVGTHAYVEAIGTAILVLGTLLILRRMEGMLQRRWVRRRYSVTLAPGVDDIDALEEALEKHGVNVRLEHLERTDGGLQLLFGVSGPRKRHRKMMRHLAADQNVRTVGRA